MSTKKTQADTPLPDPGTIEPMQLPAEHMLWMLQGPAFDLLYKILGCSGRDVTQIDRLAARNNAVGKRKSTTVSGGFEDGKPYRRIEYGAPAGKTIIQTKRPGALPKTSHWIRGLFVLIFMELTERGIARTESDPYRETLIISANRIAQVGLCKSTDAARKQIQKHIPLLESLEVGGYLNKNKSKDKSGQTYKLFEKAELTGGNLVLHLGKKVPWDLFTQYLLLLPENFLQLSPEAQAVGYEGLYRLRTNKKQAAEKRVITVSGYALQEILNLPNVDDCGRHPERFIFGPMQEAVNECAALFAPYGFKFDLHSDNQLGAKERLSSTSLHVSISDALAKTIYEPITQAEKEIKKAAAVRRQKIEDKAMQNVIENTLKANKNKSK